MTTTGYLDLADRLERSIASARPGARLPSEHVLAREHGVNRQTARAALQTLERRHLVLRHQGRGTFVPPRITYRVGRDVPASFSTLVEAAGHRPTTIVVAARVRPADTNEADVLGVAHGTPVTEIRRRGRVDGHPASVSTHVLASDLTPKLDRRLRDGDSLFAVLRDDYGLHLRRAVVTASLDVPDTDVAVALGTPERPPAWRLVTTNVDEVSGRVVEHTRSWMRPDIFAVTFHLSREDEPW